LRLALKPYAAIQQSAPRHVSAIQGLIPAICEHGSRCKFAQTGSYSEESVGHLDADLACDRLAALWEAAHRFYDHSWAKNKRQKFRMRKPSTIRPRPV